jgi:hypothetical protein
MTLWFQAKNPKKRFRDLFKDVGDVENNDHAAGRRAATLVK